MPKSASDMASKCGNRIRRRVAESVSTENLWEKLGWEPIELAEHLERHFYNDMSWENFGTWDIDHTIPLSIVVGGKELKSFYSDQDIIEFEERLNRNTDPPDVRDNIVKIIEDHDLVFRVWSLENLRPLFKEDHIMKTEFEAYLINRNAKADEYSKLSNILYDYYAPTQYERALRKAYHYHKWPKRWIREINKEVELKTGKATKISSWWNFHDFSKVPNLCKGLTEIGYPCSYKAMKGDDRCYLHTNRKPDCATEEDIEILKNMLIHVPTLPRGFFSRKLPNSKSRFPSEMNWKFWINEFPEGHKMLKMYERKHYDLEKTEIASMLIRNCTPGISSVNTYLINSGFELKKIRTKWQKIWKAHELVLEEFKNENADA